VVDAAVMAGPRAADEKVVRDGADGIEQEFVQQVARGDERGVCDGGDGVGGRGGTLLMSSGEAERDIGPEHRVAQVEERVR